MIISLVDRSNYLRGLFVLSRKDRTIDNIEKDMLIKIGTALDFDRKFCEDAIDDILDNKYISDAPPIFETPGLAEKFIHDGLIIALSDDDLHVFEEEWLRRTAQKNGIDPEWFDLQLQDAISKNDSDPKLEAYRLMVN